MMTKRSKQIQNLIDDVNMYLRNNCIKDQYDATASVIMQSLISQKLYEGFNWFKDKSYTDVIGQTTIISVVCPEEEAEYIQIY